MINRRNFVTGVAAMAAATTPAVSAAQMSRITAYAFLFDALDGSRISLAEHAGRPILVVNTASQCGYTPQYAGLQELWKRYRGRGLLIVAVPSNDFGGQEPGGSAEISKTAQGDYHISFPIAQKTAVKGAQAHAFYKWAVQQRPAEAPRWNFHKYLIGRDGNLKASFVSAVDPLDPKVISAIETELPGS
jgi:glutathione peroxidase